MAMPLLAPAGRLLDLALPCACPGCGAEGPPICAACRGQVDARLTLPAGTPLGLGEGPPDPLLQLEWCAPFGGVTRRALHALKYAGERRLATPLGEAVAERWRRAGAGGDLFVPVPVHASRRRERGFDQAELIAAAAAHASRCRGCPRWRAAARRPPSTGSTVATGRRTSGTRSTCAPSTVERSRVAGSCWSTTS